MFRYPPFLHILVNKLHFIVAIQIVDQCPQLRSFTATLYGHPIGDDATSSTIILPTQIHRGLRAMKMISLGEDNYFRNECSSTFLELLLPCCPNLRTFILEIRCNDNCRILVEANWWTRDCSYNWNEDIQRFRLSSFFSQLNTDINYNFTSELMCSISYDLYIKN